MAAGKFTKSILQVGTYESPDGSVNVTPERLRHFATEFGRMKSAKQVVPMHWDHASSFEDLQPVSESSYARSAKNSVGKLSDFRLSADGQSAEITVQTLTPDATQKAEANAVYVSPVIMDSWRDGLGNTYTDCITHMDLVNYPVDHSQGDFVPIQPVVMCGIRMGLSSPAFRRGNKMARVKRLGNPIKPPTDDETPDDAEDAQDTMSPAEGEADSQDDAYTAPEAQAETAPEASAAEGAEEYDSSKYAGDSQEIVELLNLLQEAGITLPEDTDEGNLKERLRVALTATNRAKQDDEAENVQDNSQAQQTIASDPMIATMSLQARQALAYGERAHQREITTRLQAVLNSGRCSPAEFKQRQQAVAGVRLSLDVRGNPKSSVLEAWIQSREGIPAGSCWDASTKLKKMSIQEANAPTTWKYGGAGDLTDQDIDDAVKALTRR